MDDAGSAIVVDSSRVPLLAPDRAMTFSRIGRKAEILGRTVLHSILFVPSIKLINRVQDSLAEGGAEALSSRDTCGATSRVDCPFVADNNRKEERTPSLICGAQGTCFKTRVIP